MAYPYTGSPVASSATSTGLSTQILVKVDGIAVGGIQTMTIDQRRPLRHITEVGTDGHVEVVPNGATTFEISINRIYFDRKTITEALGRQFINIQAQRYPFDIYVYDFHNVSASTLDASFDVADSDGTFNLTNPDDRNNTVSAGVMVTVYENCWIGSKRESFTSSDYIITQDVSVTAEFCHTFMDNANQSASKAALPASDDERTLAQLERLVDVSRPGSLDARGLGLT
jgi:hypothetical protein